MRFGFSSRMRVADPFDWVSDLEDLGFEAWEIIHEGDQKLTDESVKRVHDLVETTNLKVTVHAPYSDLNLASVNQSVWDISLRQMLDCVRFIQNYTDSMVVHPGHLSPLGKQIPELAWNNCIEGIRRICQEAYEFGINIYVENMINIETLLGKRPEELVGIVETVNEENVGITFDVGHANTVGVIDDFLEIFDKVSHLHFHDNDAVRDLHLPLGEGTVNWGKVLREVRGFKGWVILESRNVQEGAQSLKYASELLLKV